MNVESKQVLLNMIAGWRPAFSVVRRVRDVGRRTDFERIVRNVLARLRVRREWIGDDRIRGADVLEIGSGRELGLALLLVQLGARRVVNVEIEPYGFIREAAFYRLLVERARAEAIDVAWPPAGLLVRPGGRSVLPDPARITLHLGHSAAAIPEPDASFDVAFSASVLQHVRREDLASVASELHRVTRAGGVGQHRIDLTDLESGEPFRHLCYSDEQYRRMYEHRTSYTNRYRPDDFERIFRAAGFREVEVQDVRLFEDRDRFERWFPLFHEEFRRKDPRLLLARSCMLVLRR